MIKKLSKKVYLSSMLYWYDKIKELEIPQPKTEIYILTKKELNSFYEEEFPATLIKNIYPIISKFTYPFFVRTDFASAKHDWEDTCFIENEKKLPNNIYQIIIENLLADLIGLPFEALVFREYIPLEAGFKAFHGNMPIAKERRYFINNKKIQCHHPYWPKDSIRIPSNENWEEILNSQNNETTEEIELLSKYSLMVAERFEGYWSVDFARGQDRKWYLIDMAEGEHSFHWLECEFCPEAMKRQYANYNIKEFGEDMK